MLGDCGGYFGGLVCGKKGGLRRGTLGRRFGGVRESPYKEENDRCGEDETHDGGIIPPVLDFFRRGGGRVIICTIF